ncbi:hypothetical protein C8Q76DRAFT_697928 [Earliella scabrosa]|nr:hypothetical protein C8Q76DRAFT_697928 [Earliella scabrosa]
MFGVVEGRPWVGKAGLRESGSCCLDPTIPSGPYERRFDSYHPLRDDAPVPFTEDAYHPVYKYLLQQLRQYEATSQELHIVTEICKQMYEDGRHPTKGSGLLGVGVVKALDGHGHGLACSTDDLRKCAYMRCPYLSRSQPPPLVFLHSSHLSHHSSTITAAIVLASPTPFPLPLSRVALPLAAPRRRPAHPLRLREHSRARSCCSLQPRVHPDRRRPPGRLLSLKLGRHAHAIPARLHRAPSDSGHSGACGRARGASGRRALLRKGLGGGRHRLCRMNA